MKNPIIWLVAIAAALYLFAKKGSGTTAAAKPGSPLNVGNATPASPFYNGIAGVAQAGAKAVSDANSSGFSLSSLSGITGALQKLLNQGNATTTGGKSSGGGSSGGGGGGSRSSGGSGSRSVPNLNGSGSGNLSLDSLNSAYGSSLFGNGSLGLDSLNSAYGSSLLDQNPTTSDNPGGEFSSSPDPLFGPGFGSNDFTGDPGSTDTSGGSTDFSGGSTDFSGGSVDTSGGGFDFSGDPGSTDTGGGFDFSGDGG